MVLSLLFTIFLVLLNGFFVAAEFAIVKVRASQLEIKAKSGNKMAPYAQKIVQQLDAYLAATQLGITLASLGLGWVGESLVSKMILSLFNVLNLPLSPELAHSIAFPIAFLTITVLHIVFGELAPKSLAIRKPESTTLGVAVPLRFFYQLFRPFIFLLNGFANSILKLIGLPPVQGQGMHSAEELLLLLEQGKQSGAIKHTEHELIKNVFHFNERSVKQVMVPRTQIAAIEFPIDNKDLVETVIKEGYSRMPVYKETIDNIIGIIYAKDLLSIVKYKEDFSLKEILRPAYFIPETQKISDVLQQFQRQHIHMAIILDEFGGTSGMITLEDIIEELVGEIQDEYDEEKPTVQKVNSVDYIVNAHAAISDVNELIPSSLPEDDDYDTVAGLMNVIFKKIPDVGEKTEFRDYEFTILKKTKRSVELVKMRHKPKSKEEKPDDKH
jgi:CBS domain containing-hemolysin-like protein